MRRIWYRAAVCAVAAIATACGGSTSTEATTTTATAATATAATATETTEIESPTAAVGAATITIAGNDFGRPITVPPGAEVTAINSDAVEHSVTSQTAGKFDVHIDGNEQATFAAPTQPGEYAFYCTYHPSMNGTLIVQ
jgi:plastocyanin